MRPINWVMLIAGVILTTVGLGVLIGGAILMGTDAAQRDGRYITLDSQRYEATGHAIISPPVVLEVDSDVEMLQLDRLASFQVRATSLIPDQPLFIGIADTADVSAYLDEVPHAVLENAGWEPGPQLSNQWDTGWNADNKLEELGGAQPPEAPTDQDFWVESATGTGTQELTFDLQAGQWTVVVMNADGDRPVWVDLQAGARTELLSFFTPGLFIAGLIGLIAGIPLILFGAAGLGRDIDQPRPPLPTSTATPSAAVVAYPLAFEGHLDPPLSRWLWLVKWILVIPHYIVLALLAVAAFVTTVAAGFVILFTGRYPRAWFMFSVGVLRWTWRVGFYGYSTLGTDRYPPFTLAQAYYPAELTVPYPERLSRGLVLVKWWLLALPHIFILSIITGGSGFIGSDAVRSTAVWSFSLLGLLVLIAAIALLFTGHYLAGLFPLIVGLNRWVYRVSVYVFLLRDEYPPFRLDQGPTDPPARPLPGEPTRAL